MRVKLVLFLSSYSPLFAILAVRFTDWRLAAGMAALAATGLVALAALLVLAANGEPQAYTIKSIEDRGNEVAAYIATYILPLIVLDEPKARDLVGYGLFMAVSAVVYVQSNMLHINPIIYLTGRRILALETSEGRRYYLISRLPLAPGETIWAADVLLPLLVRRPAPGRTK